MKDFVKWLGVNEKIAKVVVWLFIIMVMLITINAALDSLGFPHYQITYQNLKQIDSNLIVRCILNIIVCIFNFYSTVLLVFRTKEIKNIFKYSIIYVILSWVITKYFNYGILQVFIVLFILGFCYLYSNKKAKYVLYGFLSLAINTIVQGITYTYKINLINFPKLNAFTRALLSIDYFIIMAIIILVKEIYLKKRRGANL